MASSPVGHQRHVIVLGRPAVIIHIKCAGAGSPADIDQCWNGLFGKMLKLHGITVLLGLYVMSKSDVPSAAIDGVGACNDILIRINGHSARLLYSIRIECNVG